MVLENMKKKIADNLKRIQENIVEACARAKRGPGEVRLIAVTKTVEPDIIREVLAQNVTDLGESKVQDLLQRNAIIEESIQRRAGLSEEEKTPSLPRPHWHMIGHLQRNKVKQLLPIVTMIHSVDSLRLAEEINTMAARLGLAQKVKILMEINTSQEKQKYGLAVGAVSAMAEQIETLPNISLVGLMTMAPLTDDTKITRFCFTRLREIFEEMCGRRIAGDDFIHLSMGMSQDYVQAVEEGATLVRIGSALFE
jgi:hypothetical protein